eukprot:s1570_g12.t1
MQALRLFRPWPCSRRSASSVSTAAPAWWQRGWPRQRIGSVAEVELLAPLAELLMPHVPIAELFRSFPSPKGWGGNYLEPDLAAYGVFKDENAGLFMEYDGYWRHGEREGMKVDQQKNEALLLYAPKGSYVVRISHSIGKPLKDSVLWVKVKKWRSGDNRLVPKILCDILKQTVMGLKHSLRPEVVQRLQWHADGGLVVPSTFSLDFINAAVSAENGNTINEISSFLETEGFGKKDMDLMLEKCLAPGISIEKQLQPKLQWLSSLGLTSGQVAKAVANHPRILGLSIEMNLKPTAQWFLDFGLTRDQVAKAVAAHPRFLDLSVEQNLKPTIQWFLDLELTKSQVAKAVAIHPQVLCLSIETNLKPTIQWFLDLGLTKSQVAKAVATHPQILSLSIYTNLKPTVEWFSDLGLTKNQVAKAVATNPRILGLSTEQKLKPTARWLLYLGLTKDQVAKAVATHSGILGLSVEQNLKPTVEWFLELGLTKSQIVKAVATFPQILGLSVEQNMKPTVQWLLELGLTKDEVVKAVATFSPILWYSVEKNLNPTVQWFFDLGLKKSQIAKAVTTFPQILGFSIPRNLSPKMLALEQYFASKSVLELVAKWPQLMGYSYHRLTTRLKILAEHDQTHKLILAMPLTEEAFQRRFLNGPKEM